MGNINWTEIIEDSKENNNLGDYGFILTFGDFSRFYARYRLAKSLKSVELEDYSLETQNGYKSMFKIFLSFSAFESYTALVLGNKDRFPYGSAEAFVDKQEADDLLHTLWDFGYDMSFLKFIADNSRPNLQRIINKFLNNEKINVLYLAGSIRNIFAHGILTPNVWNNNVHDVSIVCDKISDFIINTIDYDMGKRIQNKKT